MTNDSETPEEHERRLSRRLVFRKEIKFDMPHKKGCQGAIQNLSRTGVFFTTEEIVPTGSEVGIFLTIERMGESMEIVLLGKVVRVDRTLPKPTKGYGVEFAKENPEVMKQALDQLLESMKAPPPQSPTPAKPRPAETTPPTPSASQAKAYSKSLPKDTRISSGPSSSTPGKRTVILLILLFLFLGFAAVRFLGGGAEAQRFSNWVPVESVRTDEKDLLVGVSASWLESKSKAERRADLENIANEFAHDGLNGILFLAPSGERVALIMFLDEGGQIRTQIRLAQ